MYIYSAQHKASKDILTGFQNEKDWPLTWKKPLYKKYHGAVRHELPKDVVADEHPTASLREALLNRETCRNFSKDTPLVLPELGNLLSLACGETGVLIPELDGKVRRTYPSGGALFPIETYVFLRAPVAHLQPGLYHYCPDIHVLEELDTDCGADALAGMLVYPWMYDAPVVVLLTAVFPRSTDKYRERGYRFTLLEAGHIAQNLALVAGSMGLGSMEGGTRDERIETFLDIDGTTEGLVTNVFVGKQAR